MVFGMNGTELIGGVRTVVKDDDAARAGDLLDEFDSVGVVLCLDLVRIEKARVL